MEQIVATLLFIHLKRISLKISNKCIFIKNLIIEKYIYLLLIIISCSEIDNKNIKVQVPIPTSINSLFNEKPEIIKLDLTSSSQIESWVQMISFTEKFSDLFDKEINHKSKIKLISTDLKK